jgi:hypothetical protein
MSTSSSPISAAPPRAPQTEAAKPRVRRPLRLAVRQRSREAKQRAAAILEVLAGVRTPADAAQALGVSLPRYYHLEENALAGLVAACEVQPRGPRPDGQRRVRALEQECARWQRECARQQALVRAAQRGLGLAAPAPAPPKAAGKKRRRPTVRALRSVARLRAEEESAPTSAATAASPPQ